MFASERYNLSHKVWHSVNSQSLQKCDGIHLTQVEMEPHATAKAGQFKMGWRRNRWNIALGVRLLWTPSTSYHPDLQRAKAGKVGNSKSRKSWKPAKAGQAEVGNSSLDGKVQFPPTRKPFGHFEMVHHQTNFYWEIILFETQWYNQLWNGTPPRPTNFNIGIIWFETQCYVQFVNTILIGSPICVYTILIKVFAWTDITLKAFMWMFQSLDSATACWCLY